MTVVAWLRRTDWLWEITGGFYPLAYLYWYLPALLQFPESVRVPPEGFPWHWTLDLVVTAVTGLALVSLGFRRAAGLSTD